MKRLKRYMSGITLKKQYIFKFILVMLLPLVTAEAVFYTLHVRSVEKDAVKLIEYRLAQSQQLVDARVKELMEIAVRTAAFALIRWKTIFICAFRRPRFSVRTTPRTSFARIFRFTISRWTVCIRTRASRARKPF